MEKFRNNKNPWALYDTEVPHSRCWWVSFYLSDLSKHTWSLLFNCSWPVAAEKNMLVKRARDNFLYDISHTIVADGCRRHNSRNESTKHDAASQYHPFSPLWHLRILPSTLPTQRHHLMHNRLLQPFSAFNTRLLPHYFTASLRLADRDLTHDGKDHSCVSEWAK